MKLRPDNYKSMFDLMKRKLDPSFRVLATAGYHLADSFYQLHSRGLCYRDISFGNVFFDPDSGEVLVCDNDNVSFDGQGEVTIGGTPRFIAPELVRGETGVNPSIDTDLFSLAVLLFYMFMIHHPLEGELETKIHCLDLAAMRKLYGTDATFIFDPQNPSNWPVPGLHDNALIYWPIYPQFLRERFVAAFTEGIRDPQHGRIRETVWRQDMVSLRDAIFYCGNCGAENFYDGQMLRQNGTLAPCWRCQQPIQLPPRLRINREIIMLNYNTKLYPHHTSKARWDFSKPVAEISQHPQDPSIWGLKNLSSKKWTTKSVDGAIQEIEPGRSVRLAVGTVINFGAIEGEIRV
jgi:serine/threonine protein kinase